jgi:hypothetical protein
MSMTVAFFVLCRNARPHSSGSPWVGMPMAKLAISARQSLHRLGRAHTVLFPTDWAHPCHICTDTGLTPATSAPGLGSCHVCTRTGLSPCKRFVLPAGISLWRRNALRLLPMRTRRVSLIAAWRVNSARRAAKRQGTESLYHPAGRQWGAQDGCKPSCSPISYMRRATVQRVANGVLSALSGKT